MAGNDRKGMWGSLHSRENVLERPSVFGEGEVKANAAEQQPFVSNKTRLEQARQAKNRADADYKALAAQIQPVLDGILTHDMVSLLAMNGVVDSILSVFEQNEKPVLLENMQVVRIDLNSSRSYYVYHSLNVALLNALIGSALQFDGPELRRLVKLGFVSDFGMLRLPPELCSRDTKLTPEQIATIRTHPSLTVALLEQSGEDDQELLQAAATHHERYNGRGYPSGIKGLEIPEIARVTAVSDSYDAAVAKKNFGVRKSPFDILNELLENPDMMLDPGITRVVVTEFSQMLVGRYVSLSDNSVAQVLSVDLNNLQYPVVRVVNRRVQTGPNLYPVALSGHLPMF